MAKLGNKFVFIAKWVGVNPDDGDQKKGVFPVNREMGMGESRECAQWRNGEGNLWLIAKWGRESCVNGELKCQMLA